MDRMKKETAIIILAAGLGKRMKSDKAKVLHCLQGRAMVLYVVESAAQVAGENIVVVTGHQAEDVRRSVSENFVTRYAYQAEQLGTGHAVQCALPEIPADINVIVILCGDVPLLSVETLTQLIAWHQRNQDDITVLAVEVENPTGYGRMIIDSDGKVNRIVEEVDATETERLIKKINTGIYCINRNSLEITISQIKPENQQKEFYLTDIVEIGKREGMKIGMMLGPDPDEVIGINSPQDLSMAEKLMLQRKMKIS